MRNNSLENTPELAYSVQYPWGQLHVTEEADKTYGFIPLTSVIEGNEIRPDMPTDSERAVVHLTLVAPDQKEADPIRPDKKIKKIVPVTSTIWLSHGKSAALQEMKDGLHLIGQIEGLSSEQLDELKDMDGIGLDERLEHDVPQLLAHHLCDVVQRESSHAVYEHMVQTSEKHYNRSMHLLGYLGVGGMAGYLGLQLLTHHQISPTEYGVSVAYGTLVAANGNMKIKRLVKDRQKTTARLQASSMALGTIIASDIHTTYCRDQFDRQIEQS